MSRSRGADVAARPPAAAEASPGSGQPGAAPGYQPPFSAGWWTRNPRYVLYMLRELTAVPVAAWMVWFLVEIARARGGAAGYRPNGGPVFVVFSLVCLVFALWHSVTFLRLSGLIVRIPMGERTVPARGIVAGSFALMLVATVVIGGVLIAAGR